MFQIIYDVNYNVFFYNFTHSELILTNLINTNAQKSINIFILFLTYNAYNKTACWEGECCIAE